MIKVTFLGTADQIPSVRRNHSAIHVSYNEENFLVDCGEGTQRQFRRARINPCRVTRFLITHLHGDHVLGVPGFLQTLSLNGYNKTLFIYGPKGTKEFVRRALDFIPFQREYEIKVKEVTTGKFFEGKDFYLASEEMTHGLCCNAYCFVRVGQRRIDKEKLKKLKISPGHHLQKLKQGKNIIFDGKKYLAKDLTYMDSDFKISIVLDTSVNSKIVSFVKNSNLLISESSFGSELKDKARKHNHLTSLDAANIAKKSKSKKLILTHISQRYEMNLDEILNQAKSIFPNTFLAKDFDVFEE